MHESLDIKLETSNEEVQIYISFTQDSDTGTVQKKRKLKRDTTSAVVNKSTLELVKDKIDVFDKFLEDWLQNAEDSEKFHPKRLEQLCLKHIPRNVLEKHGIITKSIDNLENNAAGKFQHQNKIVELLLNADFCTGQINLESIFSEEGRNPVYEQNNKDEFDADSNDFNLVENGLFLQKFKETLGIEKLYSHQAEAIKKTNQNQNVIITTATSSGKSLVFQHAILKTVLSEISLERKTALLIFPTKALQQDQFQKLNEIFSSFLQKGDSKTSSMCNIVVYDGDTPLEQRRSLGGTQPIDVLITNPDSLHCSILPHSNSSNNSRWRLFLQNLKLVVIDEVHVYNQSFGMHMKMILARLLRICSHFTQSDSRDRIQFILSSATIENPLKFAVDLTNTTHFELISVDGSPKKPQDLVVWNSSKNNSNSEKGYLSDVVDIGFMVVQSNVKTILFCRTREQCELIYFKLVSKLKTYGKEELIEYVQPYRGGYTPQERRNIEKLMFNNRIRLIISTSALELGIDIGSLELTIILGMPYSKTQYLQQIGRSGRISSRPLECNHVLNGDGGDRKFAQLERNTAIVVLYDLVTKNTNGSSEEQRREDIDQESSNGLQAVRNLELLDCQIAYCSDIVKQHLQCAAFELAIRVGELEGDTVFSSPDGGRETLSGIRFPGTHQASECTCHVGQRVTNLRWYTHINKNVSDPDEDSENISKLAEETLLFDSKYGTYIPTLYYKPYPAIKVPIRASFVNEAHTNGLGPSGNEYGVRGFNTIDGRGGAVGNNDWTIIEFNGGGFSAYRVLETLEPYRASDSLYKDKVYIFKGEYYKITGFLLDLKIAISRKLFVSEDKSQYRYHVTSVGDVETSIDILQKGIGTSSIHGSNSLIKVNNKIKSYKLEDRNFSFAIGANRAANVGIDADKRNSNSKSKSTICYKIDEPVTISYITQALMIRCLNTNFSQLLCKTLNSTDSNSGNSVSNNDGGINSKDISTHSHISVGGGAVNSFDVSHLLCHLFANSIKKICGISRINTNCCDFINSNNVSNFTLVQNWNRGENHGAGDKIPERMLIFYSPTNPAILRALYASHSDKSTDLFEYLLAFGVKNIIRSCVCKSGCFNCIHLNTCSRNPSMNRMLLMELKTR